MPVICIASAKGGVGKTTLAVNLAALAADDNANALIIDLDPQRSAADWRTVRTVGRPLPRVAAATIDQLPELLAAAKAEGLNLVVLDTPPHATSEIFEAARLSDLVLIPVRPAVLDLRSAARTLDGVAGMGKPYAVVLNACPTTGRGEAGVVRESREALAPHPVAPVALTQRAALQHAMIDGRAVHEYEPGGKAAAEMRDLYTWTRGKLTKW